MKNSSLYDMHKTIKAWKIMCDNGEGNKIIYATGHLWWKKKYSVNRMLKEAAEDSELWKEYVDAVTISIAFNSF